MSEQASLPYGGDNDPNSGFSGSETSEARARSEDSSGITGRRQRMVMEWVTSQGAHGMTWQEVARAGDLHHGQASSALSNLHRDGRLARLTVTRNRCAIYVHPDYVAGRVTVVAGVNSTTRMLDDMASILTRYSLSVNRMGQHIHRAADPQPGCLACDANNVLRRYEARK